MFRIVTEIPYEKLTEFLPLFNEHKYFRTILKAIPNLPKGRGFTDDLENPDIILFLLSGEKEGLCYIAGNIQSPIMEGVLDLIPENTHIYTPNLGWVSMLEKHWENLKHFERTDFSSENLSLKHIKKLITPLPDGFKIERINFETVKQLADNFPEDPIGVYAHGYPGGPDKFVKEGIGFCIKDKENIVSVVMTSILFNYELEINTSQEYRRRGFATIVCAKLIEYCLKREIRLHWDAENDESVKLALKLGFTKPELYCCYFWQNE